MNADQLNLERIRATRQDGPCVSIYLAPPQGALTEQTPVIQLHREMTYARDLLGTSMSKGAAADFLRPLWLVARDELLKEERGSIALFKSGEVAACVRLRGETPPRTVVARDYHVKPLFDEPPRLAAELAERAIRDGRALTDLHPVAQALRAGRARRLWVAGDVTCWGILNRRRGSIVLHPRQLNDRDGDVLDDLAEWGLDQGIEVHVLPRDRIPGRHAVIAEI
jgi:hypothetical protein